MRYLTVLLTAIVALNSAFGSIASDTSTTASISPTEALEAVQSVAVPTGLTFTGSVEALKPPSKSLSKKDEKDQHHEGYGGWGGWGGDWGGWGGWGGFGPYRFGCLLNGISGWAYPLNYWNLFGAGMYGGGCGLGFSYGGLYYC